MKAINVEEIDFAKSGGMVPVIAQDYSSKNVLMVAFANEFALKETLRTGYAHYWSRSRNKLWMKGEESGHLQKIRKVLVDCDSDTILYLVDQKGPACHTNKPTCFHNFIPLARGKNSK